MQRGKNKNNTAVDGQPSQIMEITTTQVNYTQKTVNQSASQPKKELGLRPYDFQFL